MGKVIYQPELKFSISQS